MSTEFPCKVTNRHGLELACVVHQPETNLTSPCVLVLHGFTGFKDQEHIRHHAQELSKQGFVAIRFDASGFGESGGTTEEDFRASNYLCDIEDVLDFAKTLSFINADWLGLCGMSLGAQLALIVTAKRKDIKACCAIMPPTSLIDCAGTINLTEWQQSGWFIKYCDAPVAREVRIPWAMAEDASKLNTLDYVSTISAPILLLYGTEDTTVPPANTMRVYEALTCPKKIIALEGFSHRYRGSEEQIQTISNHVTTFFKEQVTA